MELEYLKDFVKMAEYENLFETSERLFISSSTLSRHIRSIEDSLQIQLFERTARTMKLNHYGEVFLEYAKQMIRLDERCRQVLKEEQIINADVLHIASLRTSWGYSISPAIENFKRTFPEYIVYVCEADTMENWEYLRKDECDFAFVMEQKEERAGITRIPFAQDQLSVILPAGHPLVTEKVISPEKLQAEQLFLPDPKSYVYQLCVNLFERERIKPKVSVTACRDESLIYLVQQGRGVAILMKKAAEEFLNDALVLRPLMPTTKVDINLVYRQRCAEREIDRKFIDFVTKMNPINSCQKDGSINQEKGW